MGSARTSLRVYPDIQLTPNVKAKNRHTSYSPTLVFRTFMYSHSCSYASFALFTHSGSGCAFLTSSARSMTEHSMSLSLSRFLTTLNSSSRDCRARTMRSVSNWARIRVARARFWKEDGETSVDCPKRPVGDFDQDTRWGGRSKKDKKSLEVVLGAIAKVRRLGESLTVCTRCKWRTLRVSINGRMGDGRAR